MGSDEKPEPLIESEDAEPAKPVSDEMDVKRSANTKQRREKSQRRGFEKERVAAEGLQPRRCRASPIFTNSGPRTPFLLCFWSQIFDLLAISAVLPSACKRAENVAKPLSMCDALSVMHGGWWVECGMI